MPDSDVTLFATFKLNTEQRKVPDISDVSDINESDISTGDSNNIALLAILGIISLCGAGFVYKRKGN